MIPPSARARSFLRTFLFQAAWNYDRMQSLGFAFAALPSLRSTHREPEALHAAVRRQLDYFNTHPYLAPALVGASLALEEEVSAGRRRPEAVASFKNGIMGSYGAIGDSFFWSALRPFGATVAVLLLLAGTGIYGPILFVAGFGLVALAIRVYGFFVGVAVGPEVVARLARLDFSGGTRGLKIASAAAAGMAAALWAARSPSPFPGISAGAVAFPLVVVLAGGARRGVSPAWLAVVAALVVLVGRGWGTWR